MNESVAACFSSWQNVSLDSGGALIRSHVIEPLNAELFLALTYREDDGCNSPSTCRVEERLTTLMPLVQRLSFEPMMKTADFVLELESLPHWPRLLATINATPGRSCRRDPHWYPEGTCLRSRGRRGIFRDSCAHVSPYTCVGIKQAFLAPVISAPHLHILHQLHGHGTCLRLISTQEREQRHGLRYDRVLWSRLDHRWLLPHPPPVQLPRACGAWVPFGEDYLGLNDRHALLERDAAEVYLGRYQMILDGRVMRALPYLRERGQFRGVFEDRIHVLP